MWHSTIGQLTVALHPNLNLDWLWKAIATEQVKTMLRISRATLLPSPLPMANYSLPPIHVCASLLEEAINYPSADLTSESYPPSRCSDESDSRPAILATLISDTTESDKESMLTSKHSEDEYTEKARGIVLLPKWQQYRTNFVFFLLALISLTGTTVVAYLSSSTQPIAAFSNPKIIVLALTIGSGVSVFLLGQLVSSAFDHIRWTLAASPGGIDLATFLGLSKATDLLGVLSIVFSDNQLSPPKWCIQRYQ